MYRVANEADWIVVDGYQFDSAYQKALRAAGMKVLFIDDNGEASPYSADLILNQNLHASEAMYRDRASPTSACFSDRATSCCAASSPSGAPAPSRSPRVLAGS